MSYILEALKKLEEKRLRSETPLDLLTSPEAAPQENEKRPQWHYLIVVLLLLNAGLLLWWLRPWQGPGPGKSNLRTESSLSPASPVYTPEAGVWKGAQKARPDRAVSGNDVSSRREVSVSETLNVSPAEKPHVTGKSAERDEQKICRFNDLPASVRQELPGIMISGHFYAADPLSRVVVINGRAVHEGETLAGGMRLEQITSDGVVMDYQGYRFRKGVF